VSTSSTTTTLACPPDGFAGLRCVLAGGLHRPECQIEEFSHRIERRFARAEALIDRAERATKARRARHKLRLVAKLLGKASDGVERLGERGKLAPDCATALSATLTDGERRAGALATTF
jgi:hypothetical protein